jgi:uracil-DNA glycosylase
MDTSEPITSQLSAAEAAHAAQQWLRMLAQAGVTMLPSVGPEQAKTNSSASGFAELWQQIIAVPEPTLTARTENPEPRPATAPTSVDSRPVVGTAPHSTEVAPSSNTSPSPRTSQVTRASQSPSGPKSAPTFKAITPQIAKAALATYPNLPDAERVIQLQQIEAQVKTCTQCVDLVKFRTQPVFGVGNVRPRLVMMGEAPGADEDRLGEPFVGASGQLLDKIIAAMSLRRQDVYILNSVKCRPPQNRNPTDIECLNCRPYWEGQLELLQPEVIVCLGAVASKTLLQTTQPVGQLRGSIHEYRGAKVVVTYHPSYLLRTESAKRQTWDDMKVVMNILGLSR